MTKHAFRDNSSRKWISETGLADADEPVDLLAISRTLATSIFSSLLARRQSGDITLVQYQDGDDADALADDLARRFRHRHEPHLYDDEMAKKLSSHIDLNPWADSMILLSNLNEAAMQHFVAEFPEWRSRLTANPKSYFALQEHDATMFAIMGVPIVDVRAFRASGRYQPRQHQWDDLHGYRAVVAR